MVDLRVFPTVPEVGLIGIVYDKAVSQKNPETLGRQTVVLVDLGNPLREGVDKVVNRVAQRQFNQQIVGKYARDFPSERLVVSVSVVVWYEPAHLRVQTQLHLH